MRVKIFEVRDHMTCIPVMATLMRAEDSVDQYWLRRCGYPTDPANIVLVTRLEGNTKACNDMYEWGDRTMKTAHSYIENHFDTLQSGDVVDVRVILGEEPIPAKSERIEHPC